jgi:hypothetical protein
LRLTELSAALMHRVVSIVLAHVLVVEAFILDVARPALRLERSRLGTVTALYQDDPWLKSPERLPLSVESLDVLFKYGPVVYGSRCFNAEEYNESVCKFRARYPKISRALAEQEINEFLFDGNAYLARTSVKGYKVSDQELKPSPGVVDKLLVVAWVLILIPAISWIVSLSMAY